MSVDSDNERAVHAVGFGIAYFIVGLCAQWLAIPPGYSSPIWPSSAIAMVAFWLYGRHAVIPIFLAALLITFDLSNSANNDNTRILSGLCIGVATTLQGFAGGAVIRNIQRRDPRLADPVFLLKALILLGPVCCLISSSLSTLSLYMLGSIPGSLVLSNGFTWWAGDALGVALLFPPLYLLLSPLRKQEWPRVRAITGIALASTAVAVSVYMLALGRWNNDLRVEINREADSLARNVESARNEYETLVKSIDSLMTTLPSLTAAEFQEYCEPLVREFSGIQALEWIPRVTAEERPGYEEYMASEFGAPFAIITQNDSGIIDVAPEHRSEYFPVSYVYPVEGNQRALGYDLLSEPTRAEALVAAVRNDEVTATRPLVLVQEASERAFSFLVASPVGSAEPNRNEGSGLGVEGFALGVFRVEDVIEDAITERSRGRLNFSVYDPRDPDTVIYADTEMAKAAALSTNDRFTMGENLTRVTTGHSQPWLLQFYLADDAYTFSEWWPVWLTVVIGSLWTFLLVIFATTTTALPEKIRRLVNERTGELQAVTGELKRVNEDLETRIDERTNELRVANEELNQFVFAASHDLQAPLKKQTMFVTELEAESTRKNLSDEANRAIRAIGNSAVSMRRLVEDLLALSRVGRKTLEPTVVELEDVVDAVLNLLSSEIEESEIEVVRNPLPVVVGDRTLLGELYQNLILNAVKFSAKSPYPMLELSSRESNFPDEVIFTVTDNGIGIPPKQRFEVFKSFVRLHPQSEYPGSGIGLATCRRIVERFGGVIWIEDGSLGGVSICCRLRRGVVDDET